MSEEIKKIGGVSFIGTNAGSYALSFSSSSDDLMLSSFLSRTGSWERSPAIYGNARVVPFGSDNNLPAYIRNLLDKNNLAPGIISRKTGLQYGKGPFLYKLKFENNEIVKEWTEDPDVQAWLDTWDYKKYVREAIQEFNFMSGIFVKYFAARSRRVGGKPWVSKIKCEPTNDCRLEWPGSNARDLDDITGILVGDFETLSKDNMVRYPIFDKTTPMAHPVAMGYHSFRSFARNYYAIPSFFGAIPWVKRANDIPDIIQYLTDNMIAAAYHIHEPAQYWEEKKEWIERLHPDWDDQAIEKELGKLRDEVTRTIANVLAGKRNVGKFFESIDFYDPEGHVCSWKIEAIEMNIDKYIEAQTKISRIADSSTTSSFGLNPALSNIIIDGKGDSGSQMLYALKIFYAADTQICEDVVFGPIMDAIRINFPDKKLGMGIYVQATNKEDNVSAANRIVNQKP